MARAVGGLQLGSLALRVGLLLPQPADEGRAQHFGHAFAVEAALAHLLGFPEPRICLCLGGLGGEKLGVELGELLARDAAAAACALVEIVRAAVVLDGLVGLAHRLAQLGDAAHQELVDPVHRLDLVAALVVEIALGQCVGDGGRGLRIAQFGLDAQDVRSTEGRDVDVRQQRIDGAIVGVGRVLDRLDFLGRRRLAVHPRSELRRHVLHQVEPCPQGRRGELGIELGILAELELVDHLLGDVARLQDEALVLDALGVGADVGDDQFDVGQARALHADQHACLRDVVGGHQPGGQDRRSAQHERAGGDQQAMTPELAQGLEEALLLGGRRKTRDRLRCQVVRRRRYGPQRHASAGGRSDVLGVGH